MMPGRRDRPIEGRRILRMLDFSFKGDNEMSEQRPATRRAVPLVIAIASGGVGGWVLNHAGFPAGWLAGSMIFVAIATTLQLPTGIPDRLRDVIFVVIGLQMGAGVRPDVVERIAEWPVSMALLVTVVIGVTAASYAVLTWGAKWNAETAFFGAIPGALSFVIAIASDRGADLPRIAASQSLRLFILVAVLPVIIAGVPGDAPQSAAMLNAIPLEHVVFGLGLCLGASWGAAKIGVPGGWMTGAFFMSAVLNASGVMTLALPDVVLVPCFVVLGALVGCRFGQTPPGQFANLFIASLGAFAAGFAVSALGALLAASWLVIPFGQALLAYAPGGLEVMTLLAFMLDLDPAFVAAHQLTRYTLMVLVLPFATAMFFGSRVAESAHQKHKD